MQREHDLLDDLGAWLDLVLKQGKFTVVVAVERKATAILRALIEMTNTPTLDWAWERVISSDAVGYLPRKFWAGQRILVFNELVHTGESTRRVVDDLLEAGALRDNIETAAYGIHVAMEARESEGELPDYFRFRCLDDTSYPALLDRIVAALHMHGGLLLDTEHIELPVTLRCSTSDFFAALQLCGDCVRFNAYNAQWADCVTITKPIVLDQDKLGKKLPYGADLSTGGSNTICKLRAVPRGYGKYAIVPIWYPAVPVDSLLTWSERDGTPDFVRKALESFTDNENATKEEAEKVRRRLAFSLTTLVAGLDLLRSVVAALHTLGAKAVDIGFPPAQSIPAHVWHLHAVYPTVPPSSVAAELAMLADAFCIQSRNRLKGLSGQENGSLARDFASIRPTDCSNIRGMLGSGLLRHRDTWLRWKREIDQTMGRQAVVGRRDHSVFCWEELIALADVQGIEKGLQATAMDLAIDEGLLVTTYTEQQKEMRRGYSFAAEEVCRRIRNELMAIGMF